MKKILCPYTLITPMNIHERAGAARNAQILARRKRRRCDWDRGLRVRSSGTRLPFRRDWKQAACKHQAAPPHDTKTKRNASLNPIPSLEDDDARTPRRQGEARELALAHARSGRGIGAGAHARTSQPRAEPMSRLR
jgi:hypothetical protein